MDSSSTIHRDRERRKNGEIVEKLDSRASGQFDVTVRLCSFDPFRLQLLAKPRNLVLLRFVAQYIAGERIRPIVLSTLTFVSEVLRLSRFHSPTKFTHSGPALLDTPRLLCSS